jgi:hypothetical protein
MGSQFGRAMLHASILAISAGTAWGQCTITWHEASSGPPKSPNDPPIRQNHAAVFDAARGNVVMFGGFLGGFGRYGDTWTWNGSSWTLASSSGPAPRSVHAMAYDSARQRVVLFGGSDGTALGDTWEWDGASWTQVNTAAAPPGRFNHAMAYDSHRGVVVLTGGFSTIRHNDTWEYDGVTWVQRTEPGFTSFSGRNGHGMAYDASRQRMVIFGGFNGTRLADTWELTSTGWVQSIATGPSGRQYIGGLAYSPDHQLIYLFGGQSGGGSDDRLNDLWSYDGASWVRVFDGTSTPNPVPSTEPFRRDQHVTVYDAVRGKIVVHGGYKGATNGGVAGDTWTTGCPTCYANCDGSTTPPVLNVADFSCFLGRFAAGDPYANCDGSTQPPMLNVADFSCFLGKFAAGCP